jgi:organic hydroperoxide reductase OsmC/OhrA
MVIPAGTIPRSCSSAPCPPVTCCGYLHLCAGAGIVVTDYQDAPIGTMIENADGSGRFTRILLRPRVTLSPDADVNRAAELHADAHRFCFVANSVNFPIDCEPAMIAGPKEGDC